MIELKDVCYAYDGTPALRYISLRIQKGDSVVLEGPNGCGKSTLLKLINGLIFPDEGEYWFAGHSISEKSMRDNRFAKWFHQKVGFVFQNADVQLFCGSVEDEVAFGPRQMGLSEPETAKRVEDALGLLGIEKLRRRAPYHLSGGEKKKVAIACVLSMNPQVWTLDEPLGGLDEKTRAWLLDFLQALRQAGKTLVLSTHDRRLARRVGDYSATINDDHELAGVKRNTQSGVLQD